MEKKIIQNSTNCSLLNGRGRSHCDAHHGCRQNLRLLNDKKRQQGPVVKGPELTDCDSREPGAAPSRHRLYHSPARSTVVPPFTATLILERSSAQPATFSLLLLVRFSGLQISQVSCRQAALIRALIGPLACQSRSMSVLDGRVRCQYKTGGGTSALDSSKCFGCFPPRFCIFRCVKLN